MTNVTAASIPMFQDQLSKGENAPPSICLAGDPIKIEIEEVFVMFTELMTYAEAPLEIVVILPEVIECPHDMVRILMTASPTKARGFALAMHERTAVGPDPVRTEFWAAVLCGIPPS